MAINELLEDFTDEQLKNELKVRQLLRVNTKPTPLESPDFTGIISLSEQFINKVYDDGFNDTSIMRDIFNNSLFAIYGDDILDKIAERLQHPK